MKTLDGSFLLRSTAVLTLALVVGCSNNDNNSPDGGPGPDAGLGSGALTASTVAANGSSFQLPFDSAPSPDGTNIYFTGVQPGAQANLPAIFKVAASGGTPTALAVGGDIGAPFGIAVSSDGNTVYAADPAYNTTNDEGAIFKVSSAGGTPAPLTETVDYAPWSLAVVAVGGSDSIYFVGTDKANGMAGIFKDASGTVSTVIEGSAALSPQAVAAYTDGTVYFISSTGGVMKIAAGSSTATALGGASANLAVFFPAGIAVSQDGNFLLVPVTDAATGKENIARITIATGAVADLALALGATANSEGGGIHRAANADVYSFVDTGAGTTGSVYLLK